VYDLNVGSSTIRPDADAGYEACNNATEEMTLEGNIGAGTGATIGKWNGIEFCMKGGVGSVSQKQEELVVGVIAIVNAVGDVIDSDGSVLAGAKIGNAKSKIARTLLLLLLRPMPSSQS
jgi:L-aminopeptidase/D-esterase-like protein